MSGAPEGPLARWARLKRVRAIGGEPSEPASVQDDLTTQPPPANAVPSPPSTLPDVEATETNPAPVDLPAPESLGADADFSRYLADGVPAALRRRALRVLWRSDPVLANLDGLNEYDEDFSAVGTVAMAVQTAWNAHRGYAEPDEPAGTDPETTASPTEDHAGPDVTETAADESSDAERASDVNSDPPAA